MSLDLYFVELNFSIIGWRSFLIDKNGLSDSTMIGLVYLFNDAQQADDTATSSSEIKVDNLLSTSLYFVYNSSCI